MRAFYNQGAEHDVQRALIFIPDKLNFIPKSTKGICQARRGMQIVKSRAGLIPSAETHSGDDW